MPSPNIALGAAGNLQQVQDIILGQQMMALEFEGIRAQDEAQRFALAMQQPIKDPAARRMLETQMIELRKIQDNIKLRKLQLQQQQQLNASMFQAVSQGLGGAQGGAGGLT